MFTARIWLVDCSREATKKKGTYPVIYRLNSVGWLTQEDVKGEEGNPCGLQDECFVGILW